MREKEKSDHSSGLSESITWAYQQKIIDNDHYQKALSSINNPEVKSLLWLIARNTGIDQLGDFFLKYPGIVGGVGSGMVLQNLLSAELITGTVRAVSVMLSSNQIDKKGLLALQATIPFLGSFAVWRRLLIKHPELTGLAAAHFITRGTNKKVGKVLEKDYLSDIEKQAQIRYLENKRKRTFESTADFLGFARLVQDSIHPKGIIKNIKSAKNYVTSSTAVLPSQNHRSIKTADIFSKVDKPATIKFADRYKPKKRKTAQEKAEMIQPLTEQDIQEFSPAKQIAYAKKQAMIRQIQPQDNQAEADDALARAA